MKNIKIICPSSVYISKKSHIGNNVTIYNGVCIGDNVYIGDNVTIQTGSLLNNNVYVANNCFIGAYSVLRDKVILQEKVVVGFHCEIKNSKIYNNATIAHKNFIGDALIGENVQIGCGTVTANFNRGKYNKTIIGKNTKIGINCSLVAPITIGSNCVIAAASVLRQDLDDNSFYMSKYESVIKKNREVN